MGRTISYIVDADWIITGLAGRRQTVDLLEYLKPARLAVSLVTVAEVYAGAFRSSNPGAKIADYDWFLSSYRKLPLNRSVAEIFAENRALLRRRGQIISVGDIFLAATALHHDLTVLTYNIRHFSRIPDLKLYIPN